MFSLIRSNQRKSAVLIFAMLALLIVFGWAVGYIVSPHPVTRPAPSVDFTNVESAAPPRLERDFTPPASTLGIAAAVIVWLILLGTAFAGGEQILLAQAGATEVKKRDAPRLINLVEEMQLAAGLKTTPRVYVINSPVPNAFAVGRNPDRACVAVTTGLMSRLNRDELQGVIAHEVAHIVNRDTMFMTLAGVTVGAIVMIADTMRHVRFSNYGGRRSKDGDGGQAIIMVIAIILMILAPILAQLLYFACSRRREYLADACGAQYTRYPEGLASALEKISRGQVASEKHSRVLAPMYIVSPLAAHGAAGLLSTHPPAAERIAILRGMGGNASLASYEAAYEKVRGGHAFRPGEVAAFTDGAADVPAREASADELAAEPAFGIREAKHALHDAAGLRTVACTCGLKMKLPPEFPASAIRCPRCGAVHQL